MSGHVAALALALAGPGVVSAQTLAGEPTALDGDTLNFGGSLIDLAGIDAPELAQQCHSGADAVPCGVQAKEFLAAFVTGHQITCTVTGNGEDVWPIASCARDGLDLGQVMIEAGLAVALADAPEPYRTAEALRQQYRYGLWATEFDRPAQWRAANPAAVAAARPVTQAVSQEPARARGDDFNRVYRNSFGCAIKGNHSHYGGWIYHLPGMKYYDQTRPEALFCTEREAIAAGYRRSKE